MQLMPTFSQYFLLWKISPTKERTEQEVARYYKGFGKLLLSKNSQKNKYLNGGSYG